MSVLLLRKIFVNKVCQNRGKQEVLKVTNFVNVVT